MQRNQLPFQQRGQNMASGFSLDSHLAFALALTILFSNPSMSSSSSAPPPFPDSDYDGATQVGWKVEFICFASMCLFAIIGCVFFVCVSIFIKRTIVIVQVLLSARAGDVGIVLHDIAKSSKLKESMLKETVNTLLRHQQSVIYGSTSVKRGQLEELGGKQVKKHGGNGWVLLDNLKYVPERTPKQAKDYTLVTIMATTVGDYQTLPTIETSGDMKQVLNLLITKMRIIHDEVVWAYIDPLSMEGLLQSCPDLVSILA